MLIDWTRRCARYLRSQAQTSGSIARTNSGTGQQRVATDFSSAGAGVVGNLGTGGHEQTGQIELDTVALDAQRTADARLGTGGVEITLVAVLAFAEVCTLRSRCLGRSRLSEADVGAQLVLGIGDVASAIESGIDVETLLGRCRRSSAIVGRAGIGAELALQVADAAMIVVVRHADAAADVLVYAVVAVAFVGGGVAVKVGVREADGVGGSVKGAGITGLATGVGGVAASHAVALGRVRQRVALASSAVGIAVALAATVSIGRGQQLGVVKDGADPASRRLAWVSLGAVCWLCTGSADAAIALTNDQAGIDASVGVAAGRITTDKSDQEQACYYSQTLGCPGCHQSVLQFASFYPVLTADLYASSAQTAPTPGRARKLWRPS